MSGEGPSFWEIVESAAAAYSAYKMIGSESGVQKVHVIENVGECRRFIRELNS